MKMTAIIVLNVKKDNSVIICADRQESDFYVDYNNIGLETVKIDGKEYLPVESSNRIIGINHAKKITIIKDKYLFSGAGVSDKLKSIITYCEINYNKDSFIKEVIKDILPSNNEQFVLIDINNNQIHFFDKKEYVVFADDVLIFGDVKQIKSIEDSLQRCIEQYETQQLFDCLAFALFELSHKNYNRSISSPFDSGCNVTLISENKLSNLKLKNLFRWEND